MNVFLAVNLQTWNKLRGHYNHCASGKFY